jgi:hypothetical protein
VRDQLEDLALARRERAGALDDAPACVRVAAKLREMREQQVQYRAVALAEVPVAAVELKTRACAGLGLEPEPHHELGADRPRDLLVELEPVECPSREDVRRLARPANWREPVLVPVAGLGLAHPGLPGPERLARERRGRLAGRRPLVVRNDIARHELAQRFENQPGKRDGPVDFAGREEHLERGAVVGPRYSTHGGEDTTIVVWPDRRALRMMRPP